MDYLCQSILHFTQFHGTKNIEPTSFVQVAIPKNALIISELFHCVSMLYQWIFSFNFQHFLLFLTEVLQK